MNDDTRTIEEIFTREVIDKAIEAHWRGTTGFCFACGKKTV